MGKTRSTPPALVAGDAVRHGLAALLAVVSFAALGSHAQNLPVPPLPYSYGSLVPFISEHALRVHHLGHHASYTSQLNAVLEKMRWDPELKHLAKMGVDELLHNLGSVPEDYRGAARRAGGGFVNHDLFWNVLSPWGGHPPGQESETIQERHLASAIDRSFGSFAEMQYAFSNAASAFSGSGWAFLYYDHGKENLDVVVLENQDTPAMNPKTTPILLLDLWEHAYYLDHENRKDVYITNFWASVDWPRVATLYAEASGEVVPEALPSPERREKDAVGLTPVDDASKALLVEE
ncbi:unnamed protein product [Pylaiella littoralis]